MKLKIITLTNKTRHDLKVLMITDKNKYQQQEPRQRIEHNKKIDFVVPDNFIRLIISKE